MPPSQATTTEVLEVYVPWLGLVVEERIGGSPLMAIGNSCGTVPAMPWVLKVTTSRKLVPSGGALFRESASVLSKVLVWVGTLEVWLKT